MGWKNNEEFLAAVESASKIFKEYQNPDVDKTFGELGRSLVFYEGMDKPLELPQEILDMPYFQPSESGHLRDLPPNLKAQSLIDDLIGPDIPDYSVDSRKEEYLNELEMAERKMLDEGPFNDLVKNLGASNQELLSGILEEYEKLAGAKKTWKLDRGLEPLYDISSGDSTMVAPYELLLELLPKWEEASNKEIERFFKEGGEDFFGEEFPSGPGYNLINRLVPRAKGDK